MKTISIILSVILFSGIMGVSESFAQEFEVSTGGGLDDLRDRVETLEDDFNEWQLLQIYAFLGLIAEVVGIGLILVYWNKHPPFKEYEEWVDLHEHLYVFINKKRAEPPKVRNGIPTAHIIIDNVLDMDTGSYRVTRYEKVPKEFNNLQRWKRKIPIGILVISGFLFQGIPFL